MYHIKLIDGNRSVELVASDVRFEINNRDHSEISYLGQTYVIPGHVNRNKVYVTFNDIQEVDSQLNNFYRMPDEHRMEIWCDQMEGVLYRVECVRMDSVIWGINQDELGPTNGLQVTFSFVRSMGVMPMTGAMTERVTEEIQKLDWKKLGF